MRETFGRAGCFGRYCRAASICAAVAIIVGFAFADGIMAIVITRMAAPTIGGSVLMGYNLLAKVISADVGLVVSPLFLLRNPNRRSKGDDRE
jgi:hypothetical protein